MFVAIVPAKTAGKAIEEMLNRDFVDRGMKIQRNDIEVIVPLLNKILPEDLMRRYEIRIEEWGDRRRIVREIPFIEIRNDLSELGLGEELLRKIPERWEMLGDVLILKLPKEISDHKAMIAETYARVLRAKSVLRDLGTIRGEERLPEMELLFGTDTEAVHHENGVDFSLDAAKIMFSSGNIDERARMGSMSCSGEVVVDMFAGIGYFSIPMAVHQNPKRIYACEVRKLSYDYLVRNITLNRVKDEIVPILGDNREFNPPEKVDRIIMGYLKDTHRFLPKALQLLRSGGVIHYHENFPNAMLPDEPGRRLAEAAGNEWNVEVLDSRVVKTFSPGVSHVVTDARFTSS